MHKYFLSFRWSNESQLENIQGRYKENSEGMENGIFELPLEIKETVDIRTIEEFLSDHLKVKKLKIMFFVDMGEVKKSKE